MGKHLSFLLIIGIVLSLFSGCAPKNEPITVITQNVRYCDDPNGNSITRRAKRLSQLVEMYQPDIIGTQEVTTPWDTFFKAKYADSYGMVGAHDGGFDSTFGNKVAILYRLDRFELLESDTFWLSDTPHEPSKLEASKNKRICTWALLKDKTNDKTFLMCNTHLDTISDEVRLAQYKILAEQLADKFAQYPTILTGDFNSIPGSTVYAEVNDIFSDPHISAKNKADTGECTSHGYGKVTDRRIDFCFYNDGFTAEDYRILTEQFDGYVSDHYGVLTKYTFNSK